MSGGKLIDALTVLAVGAFMLCPLPFVLFILAVLRNSPPYTTSVNPQMAPTSLTPWPFFQSRVLLFSQCPIAFPARDILLGTDRAAFLCVCLPREKTLHKREVLQCLLNFVEPAI
jgi:hypothetical protein